VTFLPIVERELRAEARRPANYYLRLSAAGALLFVFAQVMQMQGYYSASMLGKVVFSKLNWWLVFTILILVPAMTADCISREKREGTLGLLFLTPLTAKDVLVAKGLSNGLRALIMVLAVMPIMGLALLLGGVSWQSGLLSAVLILSALTISIAAGISSSVGHADWFRAVAGAELRCLGVVVVTGLWVSVWAFATNGGILRNPALLIPVLVAAVGFISYCLLAFAARSLHTNWQHELTESPQPAWTRNFSTSQFWRDVFRWDKSRTLDRNPIAWLQEYSWTARLTKWGWMMAILFAEIIALLSAVANSRSFMTIQEYTCVFTAAGMAFTAAASFRQERQTGALEILLVTPLQPWQIIWGRIWGLWCHFFPAFAVIAFTWVASSALVWRGTLPMLALTTTTYLTMPVVGLYISLLRINQSTFPCYV
jgi:ABC-type transport system involved in multi-copper enzyme maturation permease subunit